MFNDKCKIIDKIDLILGTKSAFCIPENEIVFGKYKSSLFSITPLGVLLKGNVDQLISDQDYLPFYNDKLFYWF